MKMNAKVILFYSVVCFLLTEKIGVFATCCECRPKNCNENVEPALICYYPNWPAYREGKGHFEPKDIRYEYCTVIVYSFILLNENADGIVMSDRNLDIDKGFYSQVTALREKNVNVIVALGGWNDSTEKYSKMMADQILREKVVADIARFLIKYNFGGIDIDIEYPSVYQLDFERPRPDDKENFVYFLQAVRAALDEAQKCHNLKNRLTLSVAVSGNPKVVRLAYDVPEIVKVVDWIGVMTYDLRTYSDKVTGLSSQLRPMKGEPEVYRGLNVENMMNLWLESGAPACKLVVGFPFYGRLFKLDDENSNDIYAPASGTPDKGPFSGEAGFLTFYEIIDKVQQEKWKVVHKENLGSYAFKGADWVSYDDKRDAAIKAKYVRDERFHGAMVWSLESDCFQEDCPVGRDPLLSTIHGVLTGSVEYTDVQNCTPFFVE